jgi:DNA-binding LytR/AlgR family response regulator
MSQVNFALKILIVEDDFSFALDLQMLVEKLGYQVQAVVDSAEKARELIQRKAPDAILMDIDLKGEMTGLELAELIQRKNIPTLFITSYQDSETYERAKGLRMIGFLVKPLNDLTLISAIEACLKDVPRSSDDKNLNLLNESLLIRKGKLFYKVDLKDIYCIQSDREYVIIYTSDSKFIMRDSLKNLLSMLEGLSFFKSHQSYIINLNYLNSINIEDSIAIMTNGQNIPISRRNRKLIEEHWSSSISPNNS